MLRLDRHFGPLHIELRGHAPEPPLLLMLQQAFAASGLPAELRLGPFPSGDAYDQPALHAIAAPGLAARPEQYQLTLTPRGITLLAGDMAGLQHGIITLRQLLRQAAPAGEGAWTLPCLRIDDWPDFAHRGVMLDISRDKVPTMATLRGLVRLCAELKYNQLQLYTEHTFAYTGYEDVWGDASPMTPAEIIELDALCRAYHIELVPNQNSFGHMERWLKLPRLNHLAETPGDLPLPLDKSFSICPLDPGSLVLLEGLYDELLPHFSSTQFNVGCDETFELGQGRSAEACAARGKGQVYLDFLLAIHAMVQRRGHTMQFWGDIIMQHPELIAALPPGLIALEWGYDADHPFEADTQRFAAAGVPFYVCPGTSSWNTFGGRTTNMLANLSLAAQHGAAQGALGYLMTDWGDRGHWQPLPISYAGFAFGAAQAWCGASNAATDLAAQLDLHVLGGLAPGLGQWLLDLGDVYRLVRAERHNQSLICSVLYEAAVPSSGVAEAVAAAGHDGPRRALDQLDALQARLGPLCHGEHPEVALLQRELSLALKLMRHGAHLLDARIRLGAAGTRPLASLPANALAELGHELAPLIDEHRGVWLARNRPGGLADSAGRLERILHLYRGRA